MRNILGAYLSTVRDLREALQSVPDDAVINNFGAADVGIAYDSAENLIYVDDIDWIEEFINEGEAENHETH